MVVWALPPGQDEYESGREKGESRCWNENWETSVSMLQATDTKGV